MRARVRSRWALSFADLCLLLLGFLLILQAQTVDRRKLAEGLRDAFHGAGPPPAHSELAKALFAPNEALLLPAARNRLMAMGKAAAGAGHGLRLESRGADASGNRLDRWELAAARTAAVARALAAGGVDQRRIAVSIPDLGGAGGQRLLIAETPAAK
ncbi:flagellar motor protein [Sphingomonas naphthae]|uniref:Flagellar motor protein n=1 Tax=Sphingomonas naphthae TaxID=1813468 RepID=A0ABY7TK82_9SPHN|nr:OmpA family protein [Sphingomonas naphthae]WCT73637.1 flagellar motor protein [Sphingomonas naphthae]